MHDIFIEDDDYDQEILETRVKLLSNGYEPISARGKRPAAKAWSTTPITLERIVEETLKFPDATNTGLRTGELVGIDIDVVVQDHVIQIAGLIEAELGSTPLVRFGAKGAMLGYRNSTPIAKINVRENVTKAEREAGRKACGIECLGQGQQFIALGIHPTLGSLMTGQGSARARWSSPRTQREHFFGKPNSV